MSDSKDTVRVTYVLTCAPGEDGAAKARDIALEQTAEMPADTIPPDLRVVGEIETAERLADGRWRAVIVYQPLTVGDDLAQLLNLLFGNVSLKAGILVTGLDLPASVISRFTGPAFGIAGLRALCGTARRPMVCSSIKPMGLSAKRLADLCYRFARGGIDILKDDHGVTNQDASPFAERVVQCQEAVSRANAETGGRTLYFPNVTSGPRWILERAELARRSGCRGVLVLPLLVGVATSCWKHGRLARVVGRGVDVGFGRLRRDRLGVAAVSRLEPHADVVAAAGLLEHAHVEAASSNPPNKAAASAFRRLMFRPNSRGVRGFRTELASAIPIILFCHYAPKSRTSAPCRVRRGERSDDSPSRRPRSGRARRT